jgi:hypothetical protein
MKKEIGILILIVMSIVTIFNVLISIYPMQQDTSINAPIDTYIPLTDEEYTICENVYAYCSMCVALGGGRDCIDTTYFKDIIISHYCDYNLKIWHITLYSDYYTGLNGNN